MNFSTNIWGLICYNSSEFLYWAGIAIMNWHSPIGGIAILDTSCTPPFWGESLFPSTPRPKETASPSVTSPTD